MIEELHPREAASWDNYNPGNHEAIKKIIQDNINSVCANYVAIGYYLNVVNDRKLYEEDGYSGIGDYAAAEYGIQKDKCSYLMKIANKFCIPNSPALKPEYRDFTVSKLREMIYLTDEQLEQVTITTTRAEIREMRKPNHEPDKVAPAQLVSEPRWAKVCKYDGKSNCVALCTTAAECCAECPELNSCNSRCGWQEERIPKPPGKCIHRLEYPCTLPEASKIAQGNGVDCYTKCCWNCPKRGDCGYECNSSAHRQSNIPETLKNEPENVDNEPEIVNDVDDINFSYSESKEQPFFCPEESISDEEIETIEADIIQTEPEECFTDQCEIMGLNFNKWLKANNTSIADIVNNALKDKNIPNKDNLYTKIKNSFISELILKTEMYYSYLTKELGIKQEPAKQPELPILKNNDQRKDFIDSYETWPIWIDLPQTGERYYRYDLTDKVVIVVKVSWKHAYSGYRESKDYEYGAEQYYLLGIKSEWRQTGVVFTEDESRTFYECSSNKSALVDYLRYFQKK